MDLKILLLISFSCIFSLSNGVDNSPVSGPPQPIPTATSTTVSPNTTAATSTTTETPTTSSTIKTTTTTTTTTKATTITSTTLPTTSVPTSTSTPRPTPKPTPTPKPDVGKWNVTDKNITCILAEMAVQFNITYTTTENTTKYAILDIPKNTSASGSCGNDSQVMNLAWYNEGNKSNILTVVFKKNVTDSHFMIQNISLVLTPSEEIFPSIKDKNITKLYNNKTEFSTPLSKSYRCAKEQSFNLLQDGTNVTIGNIELSHVQLEAFHKTMDGSFGAAEDCEGSSSPDIVPIAVGCALVGLVAIVLIAYLVGRRRSQARGYLSM